MANHFNLKFGLQKAGDMKRWIPKIIKSFFSTVMNVKLILSIEWYRTDNDLILGFCGKKGHRGVYLYWLNRSDDWEYCPAETKAWDHYHQMVYWQGRADSCTFEELKGEVPPLPREFPPPTRYHVTDPPEKGTPNALAGSKLFERVNSVSDKRLPVYVVLEEDRYETVFGDGCFRNFESAFLDRRSAESHVELDFEPHEFIAFHIRLVHLVARDDQLVLDMNNAEISPFDYFSLQQICDDIAPKIV
jgi:hypothetical protein